jgi:hypothetical protein
MLSRRSFLGWLATAVPLAVVVRRAHAASVAELQRGSPMLNALAAAVLPGDLSPAELDAQVREFQRWTSEYREGAEVNHAYGSSRLRTLGPTPATLWMRQLDALDAQARSSRGAAFPSLAVAARRTLVREVLTAERGASIGDIAGSGHVAAALLASFYASPLATDLCYEAQIGKSTCRPLARSTQKPVPLAVRGRRGGAPQGQGAVSS